MTLEFAPFPQAARHRRGETRNIKSGNPSWKWAVQDVRDFPPDPDWNRAGLIDKISVSLAKTIRHVGQRQGPLYFTTSMPAGPSESRRIIRMRRAEWTNWELISSHEAPVVLRGRLRLFSETVSRNVGRSRPGWTRSQESPVTEEFGPITLRGGAILQVPSGGKIHPELSLWLP